MDNLDLILKSIEAGADLSPNLKTWLKLSITKFKNGLPLEIAFDVACKRRIKQRNEILTQYAGGLAITTHWQQANEILAQLKRLQCGRKCSPMIQEANELYKIPCSQRQIYRIITDTVITLDVNDLPVS